MPYETGGPAELDDLLRRQSGVLSVAQARECGLSPWAIGRRMRSGRWERVHPGVLLAADHEWSDEARVRAAWLWAGHRAVLSSAAAAWWHGLLPVAPPVVEVTVPVRRTPVRRPGVRCRRRGVDGGALVARVLQQRRVSFDALVRAHHRNLGRAGSRSAGRLLGAAADGAASRAERVLVRLLRDAGVTGWVLGFRVDGAVLDLAFPAARVAVEVDGWAWHSGVDRFVRDRRRQNGVVLAGWTVLRFTWHDLTTAPERVLREILAALALATAPHRP